MSEVDDLPSMWSHEPHEKLKFRLGDKVADIDVDATPGFHGKKSNAATLQFERNLRFAELQEMLYARSRSGDTRSLLLVLQGMDTAGKGGIVKHVVGAAIRRGSSTRASASRPRKSSRTTSCGGSGVRCPRRARWASSIARTTRTC